MPTRVYKYGAVPKKQFLEVQELAVEELYKANQLWNTLVALHKEHRKKYNNARSEAEPEFGKILQKITEKNEEIGKAFEEKRKARNKANTKDSDHPLIKRANALISSLRQERKTLFEERKRLAKSADEKLGSGKKKSLNKAFNEAVKEAVKVKNSQIGSETANAIRQYFKTARDRAFKNPRAELQFHKFDGTGYWHFETVLRETDPTTGKRKKQNGTTLPKLLVGNKGFDADNRAFALRFKEQKGKRETYELRVKLGGGARNHEKIYGFFDVIFHRPIPDNAQIQSIKMNRYRNGDKFTYAATFTLKFPDIEPAVIPPETLGVDLGFRKFYENDGRIRVAAVTTSNAVSDDAVSFIDLTTTNWQADDKNSTCGVCGKKGHDANRKGDKNHYLRRVEYVDCLKTVLDKGATELGKTVIPLIKKMRPLPENDTKDPWSARVNRMRKWPANVSLSFEDAYKMHKWLQRKPEIQPLLGNEIGNAIENWWQQYSLKYREMHNLRRRTLAARNEYYRIEAAKLVARKLPVVFEKLDLSRMAEVKDADNRLGNKARYQRFIGSPSAFKDAVKNAAQREGVRYLEIPPQYTSKKCSACGLINKKLGAEAEWVCEGCGVVHDRDTNAAVNIARKGLEKLQKEFDKQKKKKKWNDES